MLNNLLARISNIAMESSGSIKRIQIDYDLWEYLLIAVPPEEVSNKIADESKKFYSSYGYEMAVQTRPHITIAHFFAKEGMEETLARWIQNICNLQHSFTVTLNNYSGIPPHTIYLRIQDMLPFKKLSNALKILEGFIESNECPPLTVTDKPHLTIAKQLPQFIYETAIMEYAQKSFHECFKVDRLFLLKRDAYMKCHLINTFILPPPLTLFD